MLRVIVFIIAGVAVLAYFNVDLHKYVADVPILSSIWDIGAGAWNGFLVPLWHFLVDGIKGIFS